MGSFCMLMVKEIQTFAAALRSGLWLSGALRGKTMQVVLITL